MLHTLWGKLQKLLSPIQEQPQDCFSWAPWALVSPLRSSFCTGYLCMRCNMYKSKAVVHFRSPTHTWLARHLSLQASMANTSNHRSLAPHYLEPSLPLELCPVEGRNISHTVAGEGRLSEAMYKKRPQMLTLARCGGCSWKPSWKAHAVQSAQLFLCM